MKLLFDEQLSPLLVRKLADVYPESAHVHDVGLGSSDDRVVWEHAAANGLTIVTKDADFTDIALTLGSPPQVVWLRLGNCTTADVEALLRRHAATVFEFGEDDSAGILGLTAGESLPPQPADSEG